MGWGEESGGGDKGLTVTFTGKQDDEDCVYPGGIEDVGGREGMKPSTQIVLDPVGRYPRIPVNVRLPSPSGFEQHIEYDEDLVGTFLETSADSGVQDLEGCTANVLRCTGCEDCVVGFWIVRLGEPRHPGP